MAFEQLMADAQMKREKKKDPKKDASVAGTTAAKEHAVPKPGGAEKAA